MTKQPAENTNATADEEQAAKLRVIPEPLFTSEEEAEVSRLAQVRTEAKELEERNHARKVMLRRKIAIHHA